MKCRFNEFFIHQTSAKLFRVLLLLQSVTASVRDVWLVDFWSDGKGPSFGTLPFCNPCVGYVML